MVCPTSKSGFSDLTRDINNGSAVAVKIPKVRILNIKPVKTAKFKKLVTGPTKGDYLLQLLAEKEIPHSYEVASSGSFLHNVAADDFCDGWIFDLLCLPSDSRANGRAMSFGNRGKTAGRWRYASHFCRCCWVGRSKRRSGRNCRLPQRTTKVHSTRRKNPKRTIDGRSSENWKKPYLQKRLQVKLVFPSSPSRVLILWKCSSALGQVELETCLNKAKKTVRASFLSMKSMR